MITIVMHAIATVGPPGSFTIGALNLPMGCQPEPLPSMSIAEIAQANINKSLGGYAGNTANPDPIGSYMNAEMKADQDRLVSGLDMLASGRKPQTASKLDDLRAAERYTGKLQESLTPAFDFMHKGAVESQKANQPVIPIPEPVDLNKYKPAKLMEPVVKIEPVKIPEVKPLIMDSKLPVTKVPLPEIKPIVPTYTQTTPLGTTKLGQDNLHKCHYPDMHNGEYSQTFWQKNPVTGKRKTYGKFDTNFNSVIKNSIG